MAPSIANTYVAERSKEGQQGEGENVSSITSSLTQLTLHADTHKDIAKVETDLAQISLRDASEQDEDIKKTEEKQKEAEEERKEIEKEEEKKKEENEKEVEKETEINKLPDEKVVEEYKKKVKEEEEEKEEEDEEEEEKEENGEKKKGEDKKITFVLKTAEEKEDEEGKEDEDEEVSDDENPADDDEDGVEVQAKDKKLRSRGLGDGHHCHMSSQQMGYMGAYQQQEQHQALQLPFPQTPHSYSGNDKVWNSSYDYSVGSPYQDVPCTSPYVDNQASPYHQGLSHSSQSQSQASPYNQSLLFSPEYQNQASSHNSSLLASPQYQELSYLDSPLSTTQMSPYFTAAGAHSSLLMPPSTPEPTQTPTSNDSAPANDILDTGLQIMASVRKQGSYDIPPENGTMIKIMKEILDYSSPGEFNQDLYERNYRQYALLPNESLVEGDNDGDTSYLITACTGETKQGYMEELVAFTERVETMHLCCKKVVNWKKMVCEACGNKDRRTFYSPLSWKNNLGQMLLSNLVVNKSPQQVVEYITNKVMERPEDFKRTFEAHSELFRRKAKYYPCLLKGLARMTQGM